MRAFRAVGGEPLFIERASGAHVFAHDGRRYIDYVGSWGPMILGHAHPEVIRVVQERAALGLSFGAPTRIETQLAQKVCELMPSIELVRMVSSGTEATMSAIRLARGYTGRDKIVKFEGCYHGHSDSLLVKAGSGALTFGVPTSPRSAEGVRSAHDHPRLQRHRAGAATVHRLGKTIAAVIVEPVAGNMNCVPPVPGFLEALRSVCDGSGAVLIFDEVMTGFRVALGGAQALYGVKPDLTTLGKIVGGGMPVGAFGGRREIMEHIAPVGPVYQAGTLSGNPVAMAAGLATLEAISAPGFHERLARTNHAAHRRARPGRARGQRVVLGKSGVRDVRPVLQRQIADSLSSAKSWRATLNASNASSRPCCRKACISRLPRSKPASSQRHMATPKSMRLSLRHGARSRVRSAFPARVTVSAPLPEPEPATLPAIEMFWHGAALSRLERVSMRSFLVNGHAVRLHVYREPANVPSGVELVDAGETLPADRHVHA